MLQLKFESTLATLDKADAAAVSKVSAFQGTCVCRSLSVVFHFVGHLRGYPGMMPTPVVSTY